MGRLIAIDYGRRRTGIAVTDSLQIVATGLTTVRTHELIGFLKDYVAREPVDAIVVGYPTDMRGNESESMRYIRPAVERMRKELPEGLRIVYYDERFTSVLAHKSMIAGGMKKSDRRDKAIVDEISATIILNDYLQSISHNS